MNFSRINNIVGWVVCLVACAVYILTAEAGGSFWDCGEFVSSCFKVQIPHPPGAPLFVLMGRFFIILFGDNPLTAAKAVNIMSALASGFTILFLFWSITHFARRILKVKVTDTISAYQAWSIMGAGAVGAFAYTFSDSFWYSAVEGEVYAMSSFFTAIVFWAILKWEQEADKPGADKWIICIFFLMGLSIGVHLLNLLTIPSIVMVYYHKRQNTFNYNVIRKWFLRLLIGGGVLAFIGALIGANGEANEQRGLAVDTTMGGLMILGTILAVGLFYLIESQSSKEKKAYHGGIYIFFLIGCIITGVVQLGVIQYSIGMAGFFDRTFVNSFGLPFFTGFSFFFLLLAVVLWYLLRLANKNSWAYLRLGVWCFTFMLIGYSTYLTTMIRSNADPAVDMYNVDNPLSLVGYLGRDQYGDFPLLYGQKFTAQPVDYKTTTTKYQKGKDKYVEIGKDGHYVYSPDDKMVLPRVWDASNDQNHADYYAYMLDINKTKDGAYERTPDQKDNIYFFATYQFYWMYFRYFMWNFSGKQNDIQGMFGGNVRDGNWITGIDFIDNIFYGDQSALPDSLKTNKAHNKLFGLPFILGLLGVFYQYKKKRDDAFVSFLLFFFTGFAIVLYLNQAGYQPRERDYAYVGSFYAFAIWIGLGVLMVSEWFSKLKVSQTVAATLATLSCMLAVPAIMGQQEWDDHDRSKKTLSRDLAKDYLESCAPNAILFTFGDNDTYPLWYAQEVEGIRKDVRVINNSLLGIDWYINQLRYKVNLSDPIDVIYTADQIEGRKRDYVPFQANASFPDSKPYNLDSIMSYIGSDDQDKVQNRGEGEFINTFPAHKITFPVDKTTVLANGTVTAKDSVVSQLSFDIPKQSLFKNDLAVLAIIAANKWKRPIYFSSSYGELGFGKYMRKDGLSYRLVPVENDEFNADWAIDKMTNKFGFGNADIKGVYYDEENRRHLLSIRSAYAELAAYLAGKNRKSDARKILEKADKGIDQSNFAYGMVSRGNMHNRTSLLFLEACYRAEDKELAAKVSASVKKDLQQQIKYYNTLEGRKADGMAEERRMAENYLKGIEDMEKAYTAPKVAIPEIGKVMSNDTNGTKQ
ncbi:protein O-mannosyl-transferase family [Parasediminibacterium sp. JCM 36343]|uniref:glycosyltransferase family 117 protein n=1 Tax=Parasediminibacterium sp. JCM 36343 TaxID=3374279 RepID=UPI0039795BC3